MRGLKFPTKYDPYKKDQNSTGTRFTYTRMRYMPSIISYYDINVCTKILYSILARFLLLVHPQLKASFVWASSNLIFDLFHLRDAWCDKLLRIPTLKKIILYQPMFDPLKNDQTYFQNSVIKSRVNHHTSPWPNGNWRPHSINMIVNMFSICYKLAVDALTKFNEVLYGRFIFTSNM